MVLHQMPDNASDSSPSRNWPEDKHMVFNAPRIFLDFNPKGSSHSKGAKSPTSPLDIKTFSGVGITHGHENRLESRLSSPEKQSETIPIGSPHGFTKSTFQTGMVHSESYTCVTSHGPISTNCCMERDTVRLPTRKKHEHEIWDVASPPRIYSNVPVFPVAHFLSACCLCKGQLSHGKDIYMYRGDKAFCSVDCRYQQILMDERLETFSASPPSL